MVKNKKEAAVTRLARKNVINILVEIEKSLGRGEMYAKVLSISGGGHIRSCVLIEKSSSVIGKFGQKPLIILLSKWIYSISSTKCFFWRSY